MNRQLVLLISISLVMIALGMAVYAEDSAKPAVPQVSIEHKLDYQRARADVTVAQKALESAQRALESAIAASAKDCGTPQVFADAKGDPACSPPLSEQKP